MKKSLQYLCFLPLFALASCGGSTTKTDQNDTLSKKTSDTTVNLHSKYGMQYDSVGENKFFKGQYIDKRTAKDMIDLYKARGKEGDTRSIWFSIDEMEEFVSNVRRDGGSGVRIYFGIYPNGSNYPGQTSIIAIGTTQQIIANTNKPDTLNNDLLMLPTPIGQTRTTSAITGLDPYNHGNLCPPGKNCGY